MNFADAEDGNVALLEDVEQHGPGRVNSVIVTARRAHKVSRTPGEWASDDAANAVLAIE